MYENLFPINQLMKSSAGIGQMMGLELELFKCLKMTFFDQLILTDLFNFEISKIILTVFSIIQKF
jgi:hypothetical protein